MNLGKLLGTGKSFISGGKTPAYREDKRVYLPKFGSPKNPVPAPAKIESPQPPAEVPVVSDCAKEQTMPAISPAPKSLAAWTTKLNPMTALRGREEQARELAQPVQAELSLERVKVVHNDLTDAEVEVVPLKSRGSEIPDLQPAKQSWEILGERLLRVTAL
ncbi:MAG TPA: hypothetical protein VMB22_08385 [Verrucomicrobiae bacterium]|nr:hypothetical protein [Verrucomicrobiae bacterium]